MITRFKTLTLRNFMQYGNNVTVIDLQRPGTILIQGEDLDNTTNGKTGNGVGKSTILRALEYAGYDRVSSAHTVSQLINDVNGKDMEVALDFDGVDGSECRIVRFRKNKGLGGDGVKFYVDGVEKTRVGKPLQSDIEAAIGMPFEIFVRIVLFVATQDAFLSLPATSTTKTCQTDIMEELFGMTILTEKAEALKLKIKEAKEELKIKAATASQAQGEINRHTVQLAAAQERVDSWYAKNEAQIISLSLKLKQISGVDIATEEQLHKQSTKVQKAIDTLTRTRDDVNRTLVDVKRKIAEKTKEHLHLSDDNCPYCHQTYPDAEQKRAEIEGIIGKLSVERDDAVSELAELTNDIELLSAELSTAKTQITVDNIAELSRIAADADNIAARIAELGADDNPHAAALAELKKVKFDDVDYSEVNRIEKVIEHREFLLKLLTKPDSFVRRNLLAGNLAYLNQQLKINLRELGMLHQVEFTSNMTPKITVNNREKAFHQLSAGQTARVNFALALSFADVRTRRYGKVNINLFDEVLDSGLDAVGVMLAAKLIKQRARENGTTTFVISHREEAVNMFDARLTVQVSQGFSNIVDTSTFS